jgi:hypothetical protein
MNILSDLDYWGMLEPFSSEVCFTLENGAQLDVIAVFDNMKDIYDSGIKVASTTPKLTCRSSDVEDVTNKCSVYIDDVKYRIRVVQPSSYGITDMELFK